MELVQRRFVSSSNGFSWSYYLDIAAYIEDGERVLGNEILSSCRRCNTVSESCIALLGNGNWFGEDVKEL